MALITRYERLEIANLQDRFVVFMRECPKGKPQIKCGMIKIENVDSPCGAYQFQDTYRGCYFSKSDLQRYNQRAFADKRSSIFRSI